MPDLPDGAGAAAAVTGGRTPGTLTHTLWISAADVFAKIIDHPYIQGLVNGTLDRGCFAQFLQEDRHYIRAFARSLNLLAVKSPRPKWSRMFTAHAGDAIAAEEAVQVQLLQALGSAVGQETGSGSPTTFAYAAHLIANCYDGSFLEGLATILPCYWIYAEVGTVLQSVGSPDPVFASWIESYAGQDYGAVVASVLEVVDELGATAGTSEQRRCVEVYRVGSRLEWMFWDAAYRRETWPV
jgi:thiaminase/transcriptional activator TenA